MEGNTPCGVAVFMIKNDEGGLTCWAGGADFGSYAPIGERRLLPANRQLKTDIECLGAPSHLRTAASAEDHRVSRLLGPNGNAGAVASSRNVEGPAIREMVRNRSGWELTSDAALECKQRRCEACTDFDRAISALSYSPGDLGAAP